MPSKSRRQGIGTAAWIAVLLAALVVTGVIVVPPMLVIEHFEAQKLLKVPDWLATPTAILIIGLYIGVANFLAARVEKRYLGIKNSN